MRDIKGFEGVYQITEDGKVFSLPRKGCPYLRELKPSLSSAGYKRIVFDKSPGKKARGFRIHRLVAEAYLPNPSNLPLVHHKNSIRIDNRIENLEWVSYRTNSIIRFGGKVCIRVCPHCQKPINKKITEWLQVYKTV